MHAPRALKASIFALAMLASLSLTHLANAASQEQVIHAFQLGSDGGFPTPDLLSDSAGNLYGTTAEGGNYGLGTVFKLSPQPGGGWTEQILYAFQGGSDGDTPTSGLIADAAGNLYGETGGGANSAGTVFELSPSGGSWTKTTLYTFVDAGTGIFPSGGLALNALGNLYGTTQSGGVPLDLGTVFELTSDGRGNWTESVIHAFGTGHDGGEPVAGPIFDPQGNLFGTTLTGYSAGTIYELIPQPHGKWKRLVLHRFSGGKDGANPSGRLILDADGNLYGTAESGGAVENQNGCDFGCGTVYELMPTGKAWKFSVLYRFTGGEDGKQPDGTLALDSSGLLYGTTEEGGGSGCDFNYGCGTVFQLEGQLKGQRVVWSEAVLHKFLPDGVDGLNPQGGLVPDAQGNWYGTTSGGGSFQNGTVFELTP